MTYTSEKRLYLDAEGNVTEEPPASGTLLVAEGGELSDAEAEQYGLTKSKPAPAPTTEKAAPAPEATKAKAAPPENKAKA